LIISEFFKSKKKEEEEENFVKFVVVFLHRSSCCFFDLRLRERAEEKNHNLLWTFVVCFVVGAHSF